MIVSHLYCLLTIAMVEFTRVLATYDTEDMCLQIKESLECVSNTNSDDDHWTSIDCWFEDTDNLCSDNNTKLKAAHEL